MEDFIVYLTKSGICLGIFLLVYYLFLRPTTFFRFNRFYLLTGLVASFILPLFQYTYEVQISLPVSFFETESVSTTVTKQTVNIDIQTILFCIAMLGLFIQLLLRLNVYLKFSRLLYNGERRQEEAYCIVTHPAVKSPFSIFNYIFINSSNLSAVEKDSILKHELIIVLHKLQYGLLKSISSNVVWLYR
jgi:hypothetical protein